MPDKITTCDTISVAKAAPYKYTDESLITLLTEVESIVNSGPLTVETLGDVGSEAPLSPNHCTHYEIHCYFTTS